MAENLIIIGAGVVGVSLARLAVARGYRPVLIDPRGVGGGASSVPRAVVQPVTGMRANVARGAAEGRDLTASLVEAVAPSAIERRDLVRPALDDKHAELWRNRLADVAPGLACFAGPARARELEPCLTDTVRGAIVVPGALVIDTVQALRAMSAGLDHVCAEATSVRLHRDRVEVSLKGGGYVYGAHAVICAGPRSGSVWSALSAWMQPMFGELVVAESDVKPRCVVGHRGQFLRLSGNHFLVGATYAPGYAGKGVRHASVRTLIERTSEAIPELASAAPIAAWSGYRAASRDRAPMVGPLDAAMRIWACCGHGSKGWLHGPWTGSLLLDWIERSEPPSELPPEWRSARLNGAG